MKTIEEKGLDFWSLLRIINQYDTWLSDELCMRNSSRDSEEYKIYKRCREKLTEIINTR
jgi:hypothetical protein